MPELPEIEAIRRSIEPCLVGETILYVTVRNRNLRWLVPDEICALSNKFIFNVKRRAKYLLLEVIDGWIMIHLGMSGSLRLFTKRPSLGKHDHIDLNISNGKILCYADPRRFGSWLWVKNLKRHVLLKNIGPEPLSADFNVDYLKIMCNGKKTAIKPWLMNSKLVAGLGNIYTNEVLFIAKIHPCRSASSLSQKECKLLVHVIKEILCHSIEQGGTTIRNFIQSNGNPGYFVQKLQIYGRKDKPCLVCNTLISIIKQAQRTTFYCCNCQK